MNITIIGAGAMGGAFARGLRRSDPAHKELILTLTAAHEQTLERYRDVADRLTTDNKAAAADADIVVLAVKPWVVSGVVRQLAGIFFKTGIPVVSLVAGYSGEQFGADIGFDDGVCPGNFYTALPNIAAEIGQSATIVLGEPFPSEDAAVVKALLCRVGTVYEAHNDRQLKAGISVASCGIAYAMRYIRAAQEAGVASGLTPKDSLALVLQTVAGAAGLLSFTGEHPEAAVDRVTTAGGLTIRGLNAMEKAGFTAAVLEGQTV